MLNMARAGWWGGWLGLGLWLGILGGQAAEPMSDLDLARRLNSAFVQVAEAVTPSVVVVRVRPKVDTEDVEGLFRFLPEEMREQMQERRRRGLPPGVFPEQGSGVVIREDGYILTNAHVVENAEQIEIRFQDGRRSAGQVRGMDAESDLAVVQVELTGLPAARMGDSTRVRVGEFAIAIGAPFELDYSVTFGHVSAMGRRVMSDLVMMDQDFLQTDASINPGNSGGPLVNIEGEVIGINTVIRGMNTGIGFAVPVNLAREVAAQLIERGRFVRAWLGVNIETLAEALRAPDGVPVQQGVVITRVLPDGPSAKSDLRARDVIVGVDGQPIRDVNELRRTISRKPAGKPLAMDVYRGEQKLALTVVPGELPENRVVANRPQRETPAPTEGTETVVEGLGMRLREVSGALAQRLDLEPGTGLEVVEVSEAGPAAARRIQPGEVITRINRRTLRTLRDFETAVRESEGRREISVVVVGETGRRFEVLRAVE
jgi:serine protease Do